MAKIHLLNEYNMPIYDNSLSYWSMQFISILECLVYHKNLQFRAVGDSHSISSLATMKSQYPNSFFDLMANSIQNWGMQYFMVHFLNHRMGLKIVDGIKENLDGLFNIPHYQNYNDFRFYISGLDSELPSKISRRYDEIYPRYTELDFLEKDYLVKNSDFCLILKDTDEDKNIAIFGEIEGNHGDKLFQDSFWNHKPNLCVLGIGAVDGYKKGVFYIEEFLYKGKYPKLNVLFEKNSFVVRDFYFVINEFRIIFNYGKSHISYHENSNYSYIVNEIIIKNWNNPIGVVLNIL